VNTLLELIRARHSSRVRFDAARALTRAELETIIEAARWAPTAHNMQNFELVVIDDSELLATIGALQSHTTIDFLEENLEQLSASAEELRGRGTGLLASQFAPEWRDPTQFAALTAQAVPLSHSLNGCPCLLLVLYDTHRRAPASVGDALGLMSLGCVMQNIWLAAESIGVSAQILSVFSSQAVEQELRRLLGFPEHLKVAYAWRLGFAAETHEYLRVRRKASQFVHRNHYR
jgi:nitroreductase